VELNNDFEVNAPVDKAWAILTDVEKIAPCLPGAQLQEVEGDEYRGIVKVKVGPIAVQYKGAAVFVEKDDANHRAVLKAEGRDTKGAGNASALITAQLQSVGDRTKVAVGTDLTVTGKVAQFGRGVMADVSSKLMKQFAENLEQLIDSEPAATTTSSSGANSSSGSGSAASAPAATSGSTASTASGATTGVRKIESADVKPVDLVDAVGSPVLKRLAPVVGVVLGLFLLRRRFRRRRNK
jgi:carbon monoxide dehydrogenase subunit G